MGFFSDITGFLRKNSSATVPVHLYNTLSGKKEVFTPISAGHISMYHCGPTVYHYAHIGNLRSYVLADILRRTFEFNKYKVMQVINITDVGHLVGDADRGEDKVEKTARQEHKSAKEITEFYTKAFLNDLSLLNIETRGTQFPRATAYISEQIALVRQLEKKGYTYETSDGIYFDTSKFPAYGKLGGIDLAGLKAGARVDQGQKKHPTDFALWKFSGRSEEREQEWPSPWGVGFPGWHIECSAMSMKLLGKTFDLHTGGIDHIPIHHNNEIAQSECATGQPFVHYWLHNAFLTIGEEKMGKSEGNFITLETLRERDIHPLALRYIYLGAQYRSPLSFSWDALRGAHHALIALYRTIALFPEGGTINRGYIQRFTEIINNDFNTPQALALVFDILRSSLSSGDKRATLIEIDKVLGLKLAKGSQTYRVENNNLPIRIKKLLIERKEARTAGNWQKADQIRKEIADLGFMVKDTENGPEVSKL